MIVEFNSTNELSPIFNCFLCLLLPVLFLESTVEFFFQTAAQVNSELKKKKDLFNEKKINLQPLMVFVGQIRKLESVYIVIDEFRYKLATPIEALYTTFKLFYAVLMCITRKKLTQFG